MKLWLITQDTNSNYDTFDSAVVTANSTESAVLMHPTFGYMQDPTDTWDTFTSRWTNGQHFDGGCWTSPNNVSAKYLGETDLPEGIIVLSSFNAG